MRVRSIILVMLAVVMALAFAPFLGYANTNKDVSCFDIVRTIQATLSNGQRVEIRHDGQITVNGQVSKAHSVYIFKTLGVSTAVVKIPGMDRLEYFSFAHDGGPDGADNGYPLAADPNIHSKIRSGEIKELLNVQFSSNGELHTGVILIMKDSDQAYFVNRRGTSAETGLATVNENVYIDPILFLNPGDLMSGRRDQLYFNDIENSGHRLLVVDATAKDMVREMSPAYNIGNVVVTAYSDFTPATHGIGVETDVFGGVVKVYLEASNKGIKVRYLESSSALIDANAPTEIKPLVHPIQPDQRIDFDGVRLIHVEGTNMLVALSASGQFSVINLRALLSQSAINGVFTTIERPQINPKLRPGAFDPKDMWDIRRVREGDNNFYYIYSYETQDPSGDWIRHKINL